MSRSNQLAGLITATPTSTLDTINEINASLNNDNDLAGSLTTLIDAKAPKASPAFTGDAVFDTNTLKVDATNNRVGIGTNSPTSGYKLDVVNNGATGIRIGDTSDNSRVQYQLDNNVATTTISKDGSGFNTEYKFKTQNTAGSLVDNLSLVGGNVGIGTTSPSKKLHLYNATGGTDLLRLEVADSDSAFIVFKNSAREWRMGEHSLEKFEIFDTTASATRFIIDTSGKVGIGLTGPNAKLHVRESGLFTNAGTDSGYSYAPSTPILTVTTDGNGFASATYQNNAVFKVGIGGGDAGTVTSEYFRVNVNGRIKHNDYYLPKENEIVSSGTSHNPIPFANLWGTDTTLIITMVAITWSASNGQDGGGHGYALLALDRHFGSYGTHIIQSINTAPHNNSGYLPSWSCGSTGLTCTTKSAGYRFSYTILGNTSTA